MRKKVEIEEVQEKPKDPDPVKGNSKCKYKILAKSYGTRRKDTAAKEEPVA